MKKLPLIRHLRWLYHSVQVARHYAFWYELGLLPVHEQHDRQCLLEIWQGKR